MIDHLLAHTVAKELYSFLFFAVSLFHSSFPRSPDLSASCRRGPPLSHLLVCGCLPAAALFLTLLPLPVLRAGRPRRAGTPWAGTAGSAWFPRLHAASWAQHTCQKPPPKVLGTPEISWDWPRRGGTKPSSPSAAPLRGALAWSLVTYLMQGEGGRGLFAQELPGS